jgi:hypothetical protein
VEIAGCMCLENKTKRRPVSLLLKTEREVKKKINSAAFQIQDVRKHEIKHCTVFTDKVACFKKQNCGGVPKIMCMKCKHMPQLHFMKKLTSWI